MNNFAGPFGDHFAWHFMGSDVADDTAGDLAGLNGENIDLEDAILSMQSVVL